MTINKTVNLDLTRFDSNAFMLMGKFQQQAKLEGWSEEEIDFVLDECSSGNYTHLVATLMKYCAF